MRAGLKEQLSSKALLSSVAIASLFVYANPSAFAQDGDETASSTSDRIVVTATRREVGVLDVPISITAILGDDLVKKSQDDLSDYIRLVPGVAFQQQSAGLNTVSIRGVSGGGGQRAKAPVSFYIDDVPVVSDPVASPDIKTFDIERVEVLRGPQGTLFGESALGGVIRVISKQPNSQEFEGKAKVAYVGFENGGPGYTFDGVVNLPIVKDEFAIRASVSRRDESGWIDNISTQRPEEDVNDLDYWNTRIKALWTPTDKLDISAMAYVVRSEYGALQFADENFEQSKNVDEARTDDMDQYNATIKYDLGFAELTSSSSLFQRDTFRLFDLTFFNGFLPGVLELEGVPGVGPGFQFDQFWQTLEINDESFTQEIRLVSTDDGPFRWVGGLYYYDLDNFVGAQFFGNPDIDFNTLRLRRDETYQQIAAFGEVEYDFAPGWTIIGGLRYTQEDREINYDQTEDWTTQAPVFLPAAGLFQIDTDFEIVTPKVVLQYQVNDNAQVYVSATKGFRGPGGNTDFNDDGVRLNQYDAEQIWSYEIGGKGAFLDGDLILEGALFYTDWSDRQEVVNPEDDIFEQFVDNIGEVEIKGVELVASYAVTDNITIGGNGTYIDSEITESSRTEFIGLPLTAQPEWRASAFVDFNYPITDAHELVGHLNTAYQGDVIYSLATPVEEGSYTLTNASLGLQADTWAVDVFARNLTDEFIQYGAGMNTSINEPRSYGVSLTVDF